VKLLFITSNRLGDAVLSTGLLDHLVRTNQARTTVACGPVAAGLFACLPGLERVIAMPKQRRGRHWLELWRKVAGTRLDMIVDLRASPMAYVLRAGNKRTLFKAGDGHRVENLAAWFGCSPAPAPTVWSDDAHRRAAEELLPARGPLLGLAPTANWQGKIWPADRFAALAERLIGPSGPLPGARVAVFGGPGEEALAAPVLQALPPDRCIDLVGDRDLLTVAELLRRCDLMISNDSGLMHLSAAAGAPTLGLFGPSRVEHYAPWGPRSAAVTTEIAYDDLFGPGYDRHTTGSLMTSLSIDRAEKAARALLERLA
jgi:heptosyltransferase-3